MAARSDKERMMAMERLYEAFYRRLLLYALTFLASEDEARDVVSGVMETVWQQWQREPGKGLEVVPSYLYTLTRNRCVDQLRRDKAHRSYVGLMQLTEQIDTTADVGDYEQRIVSLSEAVSRLPEPGQTILRHCYFDRMTYQETADRLNLSLVVVRKHMLKVFKILRETLKNTKDVV